MTIASGGNIVSQNAPLTTSATLPTTGVLLVNDDAANDSTIVFTAPIALTGNLTIQVGGGGGNGGVADFEGVVSGASTSALTKFDTGLMILGNGANSFSGALDILDGILRVNQNGALGDVAGPTIVANGAKLQFDGGVNYSDPEPVTLVSAAASATNGSRRSHQRPDRGQYVRRPDRHHPVVRFLLHRTRTESGDRSHRQHR